MMIVQGSSAAFEASSVQEFSAMSGGHPHSEEAAREAMRSSMATHLPSESTDNVKNLVDFAFENGLSG